MADILRLKMMKPIPQEWIKNYVDQLISVAKELPAYGAMQSSMMLRADAIMDMVIAYKESIEPRKDSNT
jgi:hypothetical protein